MKKIKVFCLADSPLAPSGVGTQTRYMIEGLLKTQIEKSVESDIQQAIEFAEKSPWPKIERLEADVYSN